MIRILLIIAALLFAMILIIMNPFSMAQDNPSDNNNCTELKIKECEPPDQSGSKVCHEVTIKECPTPTPSEKPTPTSTQTTTEPNTP